MIIFHLCSFDQSLQVSVSHTGGNVSGSSTQSLAASDGDSAVAMDFQEVAAAPEIDSSCQNCHANLKGTEECVVCRVEVRAMLPCKLMTLWHSVS